MYVGITLSTFVRAAQLKATQGDTPLRAVLEGILIGHFKSTVANGRTVIATTEAGGSTQFTLPAGLTPPEVMEMAGRALRWIDSRPDPANPGLPNTVKRLRVSFRKARI